MAPRDRRLPRRTAATVVAGAACLGLTAVAVALPPFSTTPKSSSRNGPQAELYDIATGCHAGYDRFVVRARFAAPGYDVRYVKRIVSDGSGAVVHLKGTRRLRVIVRNARAHTEAGGNLLPGARTPLCPNLQQVKRAGDFEGTVTFGLGLRRRTGFRVFRLTGPTRIVVDVAH